MTPLEIQATRHQIRGEAAEVIRCSIRARQAGDFALADELLAAGVRLAQLAAWSMLAMYLDEVLEDEPKEPT